MPDCGMHCLWFALICFVIAPPPPPVPPRATAMAQGRTRRAVRLTNRFSGVGTHTLIGLKCHDTHKQKDPCTFFVLNPRACPAPSIATHRVPREQYRRCRGYCHRRCLEDQHHHRRRDPQRYVLCAHSVGCALSSPPSPPPLPPPHKKGNAPKLCYRHFRFRAIVRRCTTARSQRHFFFSAGIRLWPLFCSGPAAAAAPLRSPHCVCVQH